MTVSVDRNNIIANTILPKSHPVICSVPPLPLTTPRERTAITGSVTIHSWNALDDGTKPTMAIMYPSGKQVICRTLVMAKSPKKVSILTSLQATSRAIVYRGHSSTVTAACVSANGRYVASGDINGCLQVWVLDDEEQHGQCLYLNTSALMGTIRDIGWYLDSPKILICGNGGASASVKILVWDTGMTSVTLGVHNGRCTSGAFQPRRPVRVVTAGRSDGEVTFHTQERGSPFAMSVTPLEEAHKAGGAVHKVAYQPTSGKYVASVGSDMSLCIHHGTTGALLVQKKHAHDAPIYDVEWNGSGTNVLTASGDGSCKLWSVEGPFPEITVQECAVWYVAEYQAKNMGFTTVPIGGLQMGCTFVNGTLPLSSSFNGQLHVLHGSPTTAGSEGAVGATTTGPWCQTVTGHVAPISACTVLLGVKKPRRANCFTVSAENDLVIGDLRTIYGTKDRNTSFFTGDTDGVMVQWSWNAATASCHPMKRLEKTQLESCKADNAQLMYEIHEGGICGADVVYGNNLLTIGHDGILQWSTVYDITTDTQPFPSKLCANPIAFATGTNHGVILTVKGLLRVCLWNVQPDAPVLNPCEAKSVVVSSDDKTAFVGGVNGKIYVYTLHPSLKLKHTIEDGHLKPIYSLALSHDGTMLASADDKDICVWDVSRVEEGQCHPIVERGYWCGHSRSITALAWSLDDSVLASGGNDDVICLWHTHTMNLTAVVRYPHAHCGGIVSLHFMPTDDDDKMVLLSTGADSVVNVWDVTADIKATFG